MSNQLRKSSLLAFIPASINHTIGLESDCVAKITFLPAETLGAGMKYSAPNSLQSLPYGFSNIATLHKGSRKSVHFDPPKRFSEL